MQKLLIIDLLLTGFLVISIALARLIFRRSIMFSIFVCIELNSAFMFFISWLNRSDSMEVKSVILEFTLGILGMSVIIFLLYHFVIRPLKSVGNMLKSISEGSGDLTQSINFNKKNEIGDLSGYFNKFSSSLNCAITSIKRLTGENRGVSERLAKTSEDSNEALKHISTNTESIKVRTTGLDSAINDANKTLIYFREFLDSVVGKISGQSTEIANSSSSIEEMMTLIGNVSQTFQKDLSLANDLSKLAEKGSTVMNKTVEFIKKITGVVDIINETLEVITLIGGQTNLLAMNAAIEAAHAGNAGKGFSIVADEIRKLAEESTSRASQISASMKEIISLIVATEDLAAKSREMFTVIVNQIGDVNNGMIEGDMAMSTISQGSKKIRELLGSLVGSTSDIKESSAIMTGKIQEIVNTNGMITEISGEIKNDIIKIASGISDLSKSIEKVSNSCSINAKNVNRIESLTSGFKV